MYLKKPASGLAVLILLLAVAGCNLPISGSQPTAFPTPNYTQTAQFKPPIVIPPTITLPAVMTATSPSGSVPQPTKGPVVATATQAPAATLTATKAPSTATATTSSQAGPSITGAHLSDAPDIDGDWSEWKTKAFPASNVVFGAKNWSNAKDAEASYRVGWDSDFLYLAVKVLDDKYEQNTSGKDMYKGDSVEILLDANLSGDSGSQSLSSDDYQLGLSPGKDGPGDHEEAYRWFPSSKAGKPSGVKVKSVGDEGVWRLEAAIPWSTFGITPKSGMQVGFAVSVSDNDKSSENVQQTMISSAPHRSLVDPTTWGVLTLQ